jgi:hypothetical protein
MSAAAAVEPVEDLAADPGFRRICDDATRETRAWAAEVRQRVDWLAEIERRAKGRPRTPGSGSLAPRGCWVTAEAMRCLETAGYAGLPREARPRQHRARLIAAAIETQPERLPRPAALDLMASRIDARMRRRRAWLTAALGFVPDLWPLLGAARIAFVGADAGGRWEPVADRRLDGVWFGCPAVVLPVIAGYGAIDLLALPTWDGRLIEDPAPPKATQDGGAGDCPLPSGPRWYARTGLAATLGFDPGDPAWENFTARQPVRLCRSPLAWLRAWAACADPETGLWPPAPPAACVLDAAAFEARQLLLDARVICDDEAHAAEIHGLRQDHLKQTRARILPTRRGAVTSILVAGAAPPAGGA